MPSITAIKDGMLVAKDLPLVDADGNQIAPHGVHRLCRCGRSGNKPFCDDTHKTFEWSTAKQDGRVPRKEETYEGKQLTILDDRGICSHAGFCTDRLAAVFDNGKEPWIDPDGAEADEIKRVIRTCPSGALSYAEGDTVVDTFGQDAEIEVAAAGPLRVRGGPELKAAGDDADAPRSTEHYALCRCGASKNKPFCDGTHWYVNFGHRGLETTAESETEGYVPVGSLDDFEEGKPTAVDADGTDVAVFRLWGRVCAVAAEHGGTSMVDAEVTPAGKVVGAEGRTYTPYPWARATDDDLPVHDVLVLDGKVWVKREAEPDP